MSRAYGEQVQPYRRQSAPRQSAFAFMAEPNTPGDGVDLLQLDPECLRDAVAAWVSQGYAISFGQTSDAQAVGVHLIVGGDKKSKYFTTVAELEDFLTRVRGTIAPKT